MTAPTAEPPPAEQATRRNRNGDGNTAEGAAAPEPPKLRRRPMLIAVSVLLTALGALLGAFLLSTLSGTDDYVAVRADIERGDVIKETDLVRTQLRRDNSISPLSWDEQRSLIGMYANVDMAKGSLVTRESVSAEIAPADIRGRLIGFRQLSIILGLFFAGLINVAVTSAAGGAGKELALGL